MNYSTQELTHAVGRATAEEPLIQRMHHLGTLDDQGLSDLYLSHAKEIAAINQRAHDEAAPLRSDLAIIDLEILARSHKSEMP